MFTIRAEQIRAYDAILADGFALELVGHVREFAPRQFEIMGSEATGQLTRMGVETAARHGFTLRGPVRFHVEMMLMLGSGYDTDPQYAQLLAPFLDPASGGQLERAKKIHQRLLDYVAQVSGRQHQYERDALGRAGQARFEHIAILNGRSVDDTVTVLARIHPEKCAYIGRENMALLVQVAKDQAAMLGGGWRTASPLFAGLMFTFGHGCLEDIQFPWIGNTVEKWRGADPELATRQLFDKFLAYLGQALTTFRVN